jgi:NDP-sugar pyrophosphorylase family protein
MKGIILAGGKGTRLYPVTLETPKPLIAIRDKPLINFSVELFAKYGVNEIKIIIRPSDRVHYDKWHARYASEFSEITISFVEEQDPMGTLGYIFRNLANWMGDEEIFVMNGDGIIKDLDLNEALSFHRKIGTKATISLMKVDDADDYGGVVISDDKVSDFLEKKKGLGAGWVSAGLYIINAAALEHIKEQIPEDQKFLMFEKDLFPVLASSGELGAFTSEGRFFDCGTPERWAQAIREA